MRGSSNAVFFVLLVTGIGTLLLPKFFGKDVPSHVSFMDHGYISPPLPANLNEPYFKGTLEEHSAFFHEIRKDILEYLKNHLN